MKKIIVSLVLLSIIALFGTSFVYANNVTNVSNNNEIIRGLNEGEIIEVKKNAEKELQEYTKIYGSESYGMTAYILNKIRIYSIPFCFVGIAVGAIYQYAIGIRRLDVRDRGFKLVIAFVTVLVLCQVLPLIFAIVIRGWRS